MSPHAPGSQAGQRAPLAKCEELPSRQVCQAQAYHDMNITIHTYVPRVIELLCNLPEPKVMILHSTSERATVHSVSQTQNYSVS